MNIKDIETARQIIVTGLFTQRLQIEALPPDDRLHVQFDDKIHIPLREDAQTTWFQYMQKNNVHHVSTDIYLAMADNVEQMEMILTELAPEPNKPMPAKVLLLHADRLMPDAITALKPGIEIRPDTKPVERIFSRWSLIPMIENTIACEEIPVCSEKHWCEHNPKQLSVRQVNGDSNYTRYAGWHQESGHVVPVYVKTVDMSRPWTIESTPGCTETAFNLPEYEETIPLIHYHTPIN